ncbi:Lipid-binding serum glycoprotein, C-terminal domain and Bactericidal permeability-increasing protein, alpha/beta domain-containing protein [Strongyloides ratti]|uniref:Lipid-binding serum glycoprotein, C-terminal domain and Bactericidal permeability-increasing protein, alpha/beta domain-containing protein n=1 Tax=Strongyloides ratti TaxID=34506 RepID=A0A090LDA7_STRRB|nr:Lipid-binding serum glycoprotein, C-terminal domain and Bactericidal permeability-increasing protein, alpha/beta domain-containing protein [Strongyloides ratti]CEF65510.1 Lipid-binding serum glycoprotein, C-terminal domain and Bactericidal permeability-increasing protein, alpha/beta domain-containing protein [Strongyloides ratti]
MVSFICYSNFFLICFIPLYFCITTIPNQLSDEKNLGFPGVKIRLTNNGVSFISKVVGNILITEIMSATVNLPPHKIQFNDGNVELKNLKVKMEKSGHNVNSKLTPPNNISIEVSNLDMNINGEINGNIDKSKHFVGDILLLNNNFEILLGLNILNNNHGTPNIKLNLCKIKENLTPKIKITSGTLSNEDKQKIELNIGKENKEILEIMICSRIEVIIEDRINDRFSLIPSKLPMNTLAETAILEEVASRMLSRRRQIRNTEYSRTKRQALRSLSSSFNLTKANNLLLDYGIVGEPRVIKNVLEIDSVSEISLNGRGGTPFGAMKFNYPEDIKEGVMMQLIVSDFVPNTLMYHGHTIGIFNTRIDSKTPHFSSMMKSSCSLTSGVLFCLGDLFPTLKRTFPNRELAMLYKTINAPVMKFHGKSSGIENTGEEKIFGSFIIEVDSSMKMRLSNTMTKPKVTIENMKFTTESPNVITQQELNQAGILTKEVLQRMVNDMLKEGIPIPIHPLYKLDKPRVRIIERAMLIQTNFKLNEKLLKQLTAEEVRL